MPLTAREAVRKWAEKDESRDERPHLTRAVTQLCDEHERMQRTLQRIAGGSPIVVAIGYEQTAQMTLNKVEGRASE